MSFNAPAWRLAPRRLFYQSRALPILTRNDRARHLTQSASRCAENDGDPSSRPNPVLEEFRRQNPNYDSQQGQQPGGGAKPMSGDLGPSSIFEDARRAEAQAAQQSAAADDAEDEPEGKTKVGGIVRDPTHMAPVLDPDPNARERWERKKVIQMVKKGGRLSKQQYIKRTEREHLAKSHNLKTSVKKLGMLARQIAGKTIDDAITQMQFSKKKVSQEVLKQLEMARDEAITMRGMGLRQLNQEENANTLNDSSSAISGTSAPKVEAKKTDRPIDIQLKSGKRHTVTDRSKIFIDQAWVGRGPYGKLPDYRARGRMFVMRTPWTSISLLLKEETTRVREYEEREAKRRKQRLENVWVPLPDRPVTMQRPFYCW